MTLAYPDRFRDLSAQAVERIQNVAIVRPRLGAKESEQAARLHAASLAGWARHQRSGTVYVIDAEAESLSQAATVQRVVHTRADAIVVSDSVAGSGQDSGALQKLLRELSASLPNALLIVARENGRQPKPARDLGHFHFLLTGDTGATLHQALTQVARGHAHPSEVSGLTWRDAEGKLITNPAWHVGSDIPTPPPPAWDLVPHHPGGQYAQRTSRVCPIDCPTCHGAFGRSIRKRGSESVLIETRQLIDRFGAQRIAIVDEVFDFEPARAKHLLRAWIGMHADLELDFPGGLRGDRIDGELAHLLRRAGLRSVELPILSASPRIQQMLGTNLDLPALESGIAHLADEGIQVTGVFQFGHEREDPKERERTIAFACRSALHKARFEAIGDNRHSNRLAARLSASARFYARPERRAAWSLWAKDRHETSWAPGLGHWVDQACCRLRPRGRQSKA